MAKQKTDESLETQRETLVDQAMQNSSVSAAIQTFNAVTALGILQSPQLVSTARARFDASGNN